MSTTQSASKISDPTPGGPGSPSPLRVVLARVGVQNVSLLIALILLILVIGAQNPNFFGFRNIVAIGSAITVFGLLAIVQTLVILLGALDISVGSMTGLCSVVGAMVFTATTQSLLGILSAIFVGMLCGLANGLIIVYGRVNPVIATLATLAAFKGLAQIVSGGKSQGYTSSDPVYKALGRGEWFSIPILIYIFVVIAIIVGLVLKYTDIGRNIYAIGGNDTAARLAGININRYIIGVYLAVGAVAGLAGILLTARTGSGQPISGSEGLELEAITAAALGGAALQGGKGTIVGTVLAVVLLGVLSNGLTVLGVNPFWQNVAKGSLLVIAVVIQQRRSGQRAVGLPT
ncbi:ABC transporter permease [Nakamurella antarctica]|uniref:ABC transporter permease n=1 Tax=Nakamurella antarctica TaxID=1902245 RepID=UPI0019CF976D|nr:ABC transporter permease [Nakamurella antarctica]